MTINAVAFDLWETLITDTPEVAKQQERLRLDRIERILVARGQSAVVDRIEHAYRALWQRCHELYWSLDRDIPCRRQIEHFLEALELPTESFDEPTLAALEDAYAGAAFEILPHVVSGAAEALAAVKERGLRVGMISNTGRTPGSTLRRILEALGLASSIDVMLFSNEHGECKPQLSIFEELRQRLGVPFDEMVFVGDNMYADVHGAQRCGMRAVWFDPPVRGTAVAPPVDHALEIRPDATIRHMSELMPALEALLREDAR